MEPEESLSRPFLTLVEKIGKLYQEMLEHHADLSRLRWAILHLVMERTPLTMSELTYLTALPKSNVTYHVDWLEKHGYLTREPSVDDRRVIYLQVTHDGATVVQRVPDELRRRMARLAERISPAELTIIEAGLKLLVTRFDLLLDDSGQGEASASPAI